LKNYSWVDRNFFVLKIDMLLKIAK